MPTVSIDYSDFLNLVGNELEPEETKNYISQLGIEFEHIENENWNLSVLPNRPDLFSVEGIARAVKGLMGKHLGAPLYSTKKSQIVLNVMENVAPVRPYIIGAYIKNIEMTDELIASLMDIQERLHLTVGRKRRKVSIGVHDPAELTFPLTYTVVPPAEIRFVPLGSDEEMMLYEILARHEKGIEYGWILDGKSDYPVLQDARGQVLSFPPIINSTLTKVTSQTTELFIDITGLDENAMDITMNILCTALADRGGKIFTITVKYPDRSLVTPNLEPSTMSLQVDYVNTVLGTKLSIEDIITYLGRLRLSAKPSPDKKKLYVTVPCYRADILHPIDIVEDVAIGYGYEKLVSQLPKIHTFGHRTYRAKLMAHIRALLVGRGYYEVTTLMLTNVTEQFRKMQLPPNNKYSTTIKNPVSDEHTSLRTSLIPSILNILRNNKHHELPQRIFELGDTVLCGKKFTLLCIAAIHSKACFTEAKSLVTGMMKDLNRNVELRPDEHNSFIPGRCATIILGNKKIGTFGELHPRVLTEFELEHPVFTIELNVDAIL